MARNRTPVALKTALPIAGATAMIGVSLPPADGKSGRSARTVSMPGASLLNEARRSNEARHWVVREERVSDAPVLESNFLAQSTAQTHDDAALHLCAKVGWVLDRPALKGLSARPRRPMEGKP